MATTFQTGIYVRQPSDTITLLVPHQPHRGGSFLMVLHQALSQSGGSLPALSGVPGHHARECEIWLSFCDLPVKIGPAGLQFKS
jgi:hypothetical protein